MQTLAQRYDWLVRTGNQFHEPRPRVALAIGSEAKAEIDVSVMYGTGKFYTDNATLGRELDNLLALTGSYKEAIDYIGQALASGTVWGVSGFSTGSTQDEPREYEAESRALEIFYNCIRQLDTSLVVDGGCSEGVLGLNGVLAQMHGIPSLGYTPETRLMGMAPRQHTVLWGENYPQREVLVGTTPHVLVCDAGADGTIRECRWARYYKTPVILLGLKEYDYEKAFPNVYQSLRWITEAQETNGFFFCDSEEAIPAAVKAALEASRANREQFDKMRLSKVAERLGVQI